METWKEYWEKIKQRPLLKNILILVGLLLAFAIAVHILLLVGTRHSAQRTVPELTGIPLEQAQALARKNDLKLHINDSLYVPVYDGGTVLDQLPQKNVKVKPGRTVYITINSYAQKIVGVPYVAGRSLRQAKNMLEVAGLGIKELIYKPDMATNYVLEQYLDNKKVSPKSNLQAPMGSGVTLYVGESGYATAILPNAVGTTLDQARSRLWEQGFNIGTVTFDDGINLLNQKDARVYSQTPSAGSRGHVGVKVNLKLSLDAAKVAGRSSAADRQFRAAAEEQQRREAAEADSLARARLDSLSQAVRPLLLRDEDESEEGDDFFE